MFIFQNAEKNRPPENHFPPPKICSTVYPFAPKKRLIPAKSNSFRLRFAKEVYKNLMYAYLQNLHNDPIGSYLFTTQKQFRIFSKNLLTKAKMYVRILASALVK